MHSKIMHLPINKRYLQALDDENSPVFKKCVEKFMPVHKYIKKLSKGLKENDHSDFYRYLVKLGDHITSHIEELSVA